MASNVKRDHHRWTRDITAPQDTTIDVEGDLTLDVSGGDLNIIDSSSAVLNPKLVITSNDTGAYGSVVQLKHNSSSPSSGDIVGRIQFTGEDAIDQATDFALIEGLVEDTENTAEEGKLSFSVLAGLSFAVPVAGLTLTGNDEKIDTIIGYGVTSMTTIVGDLDIDGDTITSAGALEIDPGGALSITGQNVEIDATKKISFDGGGDTYIAETSADTLDFYAGNVNLLKLIEAGGGASDKVCIPPTTPLYFDGGGDTNIVEVGADLLGIKVGGDYLLTLSEYGANGNEVLFKTSCAVFTRIEAIFSTTGIIGSGGTDDTDIDFRHSNKYRLEMTGDIHTVNLIFPKGAGNFLLVCTTDGDHDVSHWKVYEDDGTAATTADVMWAGGSVPAFTNSGVDIVSFYWDKSEQQCYGTASLAFATP